MRSGHKKGIQLGFGLCVASLWVWMIGCSVNPVGADACRSVEYARCEAAQGCTNVVVKDVEECKRFYRDQCLHGLQAAVEPGAPVVDRCVQTIKQVGDCAKQGEGNECAKTFHASESACSLLEHPELLEACTWLIPVEPIPTPTADAAVADADAAADPDADAAP
jgi:hypothetical protein